MKLSQYIPEHFSTRAKRAVGIVLDQRELLLSGYGQAEFKTKSHSNDFVTKIDLAVEQNYREAFAKYDEIVQGEEFGYDATLATPYWLTDPLDGTSCYVREQPFCTSMLVYIVNGQPLISIIYDFLADKMYVAELGNGAFCNSEAIHVSSRLLDQTKGTIGKKSWTEDFIEYVRYFDKYNNQDYKVHAAGHEIVEVATGRNDFKLIISGSGSAYDYAPGMLLVREAGGVAKRLDGSDADITDKSFIACGPELYSQLTSDEDSPFYLGNDL